MSENTEDYSTELAIVDRTSNRTVDMRSRITDSWTDVLHDTINLARGVAATEFVPKGLRCSCGKPNDCRCGGVAKTTAAMFYSRELGLPPMTGLGATHVIEGKAGISAEMMRALVLQAGHELAIKESSRMRCELWGRRKGTEEWTKCLWTMQEASETQVFLSKEKGWGPISQKTQWRSWPTEMLLARATTRLVRMIFPDVAHGMRTVEELQDMQEVEETTETSTAPPEQPPAARVQRRRPPIQKRGAARPAAEEPAQQDVADEKPEEEQEKHKEEPQRDEAPEEPAAAPAKVQRTRAPRPEPRGKTAPEPEPGPEQPAAAISEIPDQETETVDAEIVEPAKGTAAEPAPRGKAYENSMKVMQMQWGRLGVTDRSERLWYTGIIAGATEELTSSNDLDLEQLRTVVGHLERAKDLAAINTKFIDKGDKK